MRSMTPLNARALERYYYYGAGARRAPVVGGFGPASLSGLLAWWRLDDGTGTTAVDSSGNGFTLTLTNTPTWITGNKGGGLNFAAASLEKGETSAAALVTALQSSSTFTVAFLARAAAYQGSGGAFAIRKDSDSSNLLLLYPYDSSGGDGARAYWNGNIIDQNAGAASLNAWHFFLFVSRSATDHELFVDNVSVGTSNSNLSLPATVTHVDIGAWNGGENYDGDLDEVMIYNRALTSGEMTQLYRWAA